MGGFNQGQSLLHGFQSQKQHVPSRVDNIKYGQTHSRYSQKYINTSCVAEKSVRSCMALTAHTRLQTYVQPYVQHTSSLSTDFERHVHSISC